MADQGDRDERTEAPTPRRLARAAEDGQVALSRDLAGAAGVTLGALSLLGLAPMAGEHFVEAVRESVRHLAEGNGLPSLTGSLLLPVGLVAVVAVAAGAGAAGSTLAQTGGRMWSKKVVPDFTRLFDKERLTRLFKGELYTDLALQAVKVVAVVGAVGLALGDGILTLPLTFRLPAEEGLFAGLAPLKRVIAVAAFALLGLSVLDFALQRHRFLERLKMTRHEVKREHSEEEGNPQIRGARRRRHRELAKNRVSDVPLADVLVVNPTHVAVALRYRKRDDAAPRVIAKGRGNVAATMRRLAQEHGVPLYRDVPLARLLHKRVKVGQQVPPEAFKAVAAVLAFVYRVTGRLPGTGLDEDAQRAALQAAQRGEG